MTLHGSRQTYRHGCRCLRCRASNAAYWTAWHHDQQRGVPRLGTVVAATSARRLASRLEVEGVSLAAHLGVSRFRLRPSGVTLRRLLQLRWLGRHYLEGPHD